MIFAETERFILREIVPEDAAGFFAMDSDPEVHRYLGNKPLTSGEEAEAVIDFIRRQYITNGIGRWAIIEKTTGEFAGWTGFKLITQPINGHNNFYDLGYRLLRKYWGKGIATETGKACLGYAFEKMKLENVYAMADIDNASSNHVLVKLGFTKNGIFFYEDIAHNWYELNATDWKQQQPGQ